MVKFVILSPELFVFVSIYLFHASEFLFPDITVKDKWYSSMNVRNYKRFGQIFKI